MARTKYSAKYDTKSTKSIEKDKSKSKKSVRKVEVVSPFLYPDDAEKSKKYIKNLVNYGDDVPDPNIDVLRRDIGDTSQFRVSMELASGSVYEDQVEDQDLGGRAKETCNHCGHGPNVIANRVTSIEDELVAIHKLLETKSRRHSKCVSSSLMVLVDDASCKTLPLIDPARVHNDDGPSSPLHVQVDDASCKILPTDVLAQIHDEDDIEEFVDVAQNGYESANEEVV
ncbi:hypothetical protein K7X08_020636 [Anisodus acutangulus]|uniref:Uncharacterized protein n=1 Tax=Anisodus acutangulus TaxID=402998 RepID=A0A9Q1RQN2_9SOLA|nr:hypothetical protein K7X08_020636 [Anisodus acutangulus]